MRRLFVFLLQLLLFPLRLLYFAYARLRNLWPPGDQLLHRIPSRFSLHRLGGWLARFRPLEEPVLIDYLATLEMIRRSGQLRRILFFIPSIEAAWNETLALAESLKRFQDDGVETIAYLESGNLKSLLVAAACSKRWSAPEAHYLTALPNLDSYFLGGSLHRLGIRLETIAAGRHKDNGFEPFQRNDFSPQARREMRALIQSIRDVLATRFEAEAGGGECWRLCQKQVECSAAELSAAGFLERRVERSIVEECWLAGEAKVSDALQHGFAGPGDQRPRGAETSADQAATLQAEIEQEFRLRRGRRRLTNERQVFLRRRRARFRPIEWRRRPQIAIVVLQGPIVSGHSGETLRSGLIQATPMAELFRQIAAGPEEAVFLYIDSPGGSAEASESLYQELHQLSRQKPSIAVLGSVAASGGYYLACAANRIYASPLSLTGSIGVIRLRPELSGLYRKLGIQRRTLFPDPTRDLLSEAGPLSPAARRLSAQRMKETYDLFLRRVERSRGFERKRLLEHAEGRIFTGQRYAAVSMVDGCADLIESVRHYAREAGYPESQEFHANFYPEIRADWRNLSPVHLPFVGSASAAYVQLAALQTALQGSLLLEPRLLLSR